MEYRTSNLRCVGLRRKLTREERQSRPERDAFHGMRCRRGTSCAGSVAGERRLVFYEAKVHDEMAPSSWSARCRSPSHGATFGDRVCVEWLNGQTAAERQGRA